jgi:hypothetical protein
MKAKKILMVILLVAAGAFLIQSCSQQTPQQTGVPDNHSPSPVRSSKAGAHVPAHYETAPSVADLKPVLAPAQFAGKARDAYQAVREIPVTIAQLPCYCHCDRGMGHKSLHSCFEDDHAAHCAVCVDEALMAYRLEKEGLSASQIRERIIAKFSEPGL